MSAVGYQNCELGLQSHQYLWETAEDICGDFAENPNPERPQKTTSMLGVTRANGELKSAYPIRET